MKVLVQLLEDAGSVAGSGSGLSTLSAAFDRVTSPAQTVPSCCPRDATTMLGCIAVEVPARDCYAVHLREASPAEYASTQCLVVVVRLPDDDTATPGLRGVAFLNRVAVAAMSLRAVVNMLMSSADMDQSVDLLLLTSSATGNSRPIASAVSPSSCFGRLSPGLDGSGEAPVSPNLRFFGDASSGAGRAMMGGLSDLDAGRSLGPAAASKVASAATGAAPCRAKACDSTSESTWPSSEVIEKQLCHSQRIIPERLRMSGKGPAAAAAKAVSVVADREQRQLRSDFTGPTQPGSPGVGGGCGSDTVSGISSASLPLLLYAAPMLYKPNAQASKNIGARFEDAGGIDSLRRSLVLSGLYHVLPDATLSSSCKFVPHYAEGLYYNAADARAIILEHWPWPDGVPHFLDERTLGSALTLLLDHPLEGAPFSQLRVERQHCYPLGTIPNGPAARQFSAKRAAAAPNPPGRLGFRDHIGIGVTSLVVTRL